MSLAYVAAETGDRQGRHGDATSLLERKGLDRETYGLIWSQRALLRQRMGDDEDALRSFSKAIDLLATTTRRAGRALLNRGSLHLARGSPHDAVADLTAALELVRTTEAPEPTARAPSTTSATPGCSQATWSARSR